MSKAHLKNIYLKGTNSGPSFKNLKSLKIENMAFIGGNIEGRAMEIDGNADRSIEEILQFVNDHVGEMPEHENKKIQNLIGLLESQLKTEASNEVKIHYTKYILKTIYDVAVSAGGSIIPQYLSAYLY